MEVGNQGLRKGRGGEIKGTKAKEEKEKVKGRINGCRKC